MRVNYRWAQVGAKAEEDAFLPSSLNCFHYLQL